MTVRHRMRTLVESGNIPAPAKAMYDDYMAATVDNGFDWRLGRYWNHTNDNTRGCLIDLKPMTEQWIEKDGYPVVMLEWIMALSQGSGDGTEAMKWLCQLADKHKVKMRLVAGSTPGRGFKTTSRSKLIAWYKKFGFTLTSSKDFGNMARLPK